MGETDGVVAHTMQLSFRAWQPFYFFPSGPWTGLGPLTQVAP